MRTFYNEDRMDSDKAASTKKVSRVLGDYVARDCPFAIINGEKDDEVGIFSGPVTDLFSVGDIHISGRKTATRTPYDTLGVIPYSQVRECGMEAPGKENVPIRCMLIRKHTRTNLQNLLRALPDEPVELAEPVAFHDELFEADVRRAIEEQIKGGNASTVVLSMKVMTRIKDMSPAKAMSIFRKILLQEYGVHMFFFFYDGERYFIGASPENLVTLEEGVASMSPISGTYPKVNGQIDREEFMRFLRDPKEINELHMCLDETLKIMVRSCRGEIRVGGPYLREMANLVHTEYQIYGRNHRDECSDLLHDAMHAPTMTGSPRASACGIIANIEPESRGYYAGEFFITANGNSFFPFMDTALMIRTMAIDRDGKTTIQGGASIVRDSVPAKERKEVRAKLASVVRTLTEPTTCNKEPKHSLMDDEEIVRALRERLETLNRFYLEKDDKRNLSIPEVCGKTAVIIDNEDGFSYMIGDMLREMGAKTKVVSYKDYEPSADTSDIVFIGPGPGNQSDKRDPKMRKLTAVTQQLRESGRPFVAVCLGHQELCRQLGYSIKKKHIPTQGAQQEIDYFGTKELVGNYNSFCAKNGLVIDGVDVCENRETGEIHALRHAHFSSFQFHPESILTKNGFQILAGEVKRLLRSKKNKKS